MKNLKYLFVMMLAIFFVLPTGKSQEAEKKEKKKMTIMMVKDDDGSISSFDTTINLDEDFDHESMVLKLKEKYGLEMKMEGEDGFQFKWTMEEGDSAIVKDIRKVMGEDSYIVISSDDELEFEGDEGSKTFVITKNIEVEDDGKYEVIVKKSSDDYSKDDMIWYEVEEEDMNGQKKIILRSGQGEDGNKVFVKKVILEKGGTGEVNFWVDEDKNEKVYFSSHGNKDFVFKHDINLEITDPNAAELSAAGIKPKSKALMVENLEFMLNKENVELSFHLSTSGKTRITLLNSKGQEVYSDKVKYFPGTYNKSLGLEMIDGEYFLHITQAGSGFIKKINIKQ